jgi:hypothetical protein
MCHSSHSHFSRQRGLFLERCCWDPGWLLGHGPFSAFFLCAGNKADKLREKRGCRKAPSCDMQDQPVPTGMFGERAGANAATKLSGGLSLGPLSSRRIQVSVCCRARKTHLRFTYKGFTDGLLNSWPGPGGRERFRRICVFPLLGPEFLAGPSRQQPLAATGIPCWARFPAGPACPSALALEGIGAQQGIPGPAGEKHKSS